jgi:hypothetical protein
MPFPFSVSATITAGGVGPDDIERFAEWLEAELRRSGAMDTAFVDASVRFRSWVTISRPLRGIGGGVIDLRETGASGKVRVTLSFIPLALIAAAVAALAVLSQRPTQSVTDAVGAWAALFAILFVPWYLILPERFSQFLEQSIKRYYQSPLGGGDPASRRGD